MVWVWIAISILFVCEVVSYLCDQYFLRWHKLSLKTTEELHQRVEKLEEVIEVLEKGTVARDREELAKKRKGRTMRD